MANINAGTFTTRPEIDGTFGVCTTTHWIATAIGMSILERGGNAFDAGVASLAAHRVYLEALGDHPMADPRGFLTMIAGQTGAQVGAELAVSFEVIKP